MNRIESCLSLGLREASCELLEARAMSCHELPSVSKGLHASSHGR